MRRWVTILLTIALIGILAVGVASLLGVPVTSDIAPDEEPEPALEELDDDQYLWTYYSSERGTFRHSSAINIVFLNATTSDVVGFLSGDADWLETGEEEDDAGTEAFSLAEIADEEHPLGWGQAAGSDRFAFAQVDGTDHWLEESAQLHDGDYYGTRDHLRLYEVPGETPAVAIQAHSEHFDWFTLRHTVTSIEEAQSSVEQDVMDLAGPEVVIRDYFGNTGVYDSDGWVTIVAAVLPFVLIIGGAQARVPTEPAAQIASHYRRRIQPRHLLLAGIMIAIIIGVRYLGIGLERWTDLHVYTIAGSLFPLVTLGPPVAAFLLGRRFDQRMDAAMSASIGLGVAVILDFWLMGVRVLPIETLLHRGGLVVAVGLLAAGGAAHAADAPTVKRFAVSGALLWAILVALSLFAII